MARRGAGSHDSQTLARLAGAKLRSLRLEQGLTQSELGIKAGLRRSHISRVEQGNKSPSLATLERLTAALGVPLYTLFYPHGSEPSHRVSTPSKAAIFFEELKKALAELSPAHRDTVMKLARRLADHPAKD